MSPIQHTLIAAGALALTCAATAGEPGFEFQEVAADRGISAYVPPDPGFGAGAIAADYDNDGDVDIFAAADNGAPDCLFQNQGDGTFIDVAAALGVDSRDQSRAALWLDIDGDKDLDLIVARDGYREADEIPKVVLRLFRYDADPGIYTDITAGSGLTADVALNKALHIGGLAAGDINNDGWLDLIVSYWGGAAQLFLNDADGTFTDITESSNLGMHGSAQFRSWQPLFHDFNGDDLIDIFLCVDFARNLLLINNGDNTFTDIAAAAGVDSAWNEMGITLLDYNGDGRFDLYITNIDEVNGLGVRKHNLLYRNDSAGGVIAFTDVSEAMNVDSGYWGWGTTAFDADHDMLIDIAETNGAIYPGWTDDPSLFLHNTGAAFQDIAGQIGFDQQVAGNALAAFDADRDGDLDLLQTCTVGCTILFFDNVQTARDSNHWLLIKPRMDGPNHRAIGAVVDVTVGGVTQRRAITAGTSFLSQEPAEAHFGLAAHSAVDEVVVHWPGGDETVVRNVTADQMRTINHWQCPGDLLVDDAVDRDDLVNLIDAWGEQLPSNPRADIDSSGRVDLFDLLELLRNWGACE